MEEDDPVKKKRSRGGRIDVGDGSDGAIISMMNIGERTFVIKERSIYEIIMADQVDPQRTNIHVPNMIHKLVLSGGIESEIVSQIFLTGTMFFTKGKFPEKQLSKIWELIIELNKEAINLKKNIEDYYQSENLANAKYDADRARNIPPALPSILDLETSLKTIFQKAYHMYQIMIELSSVIYTAIKLNRQAHFDTFATSVNNELGEQHSFTQFLTENLTFLKTLRELRNGLDHRIPTVTITDYQFNPDTTISLPSIALKAKDAQFEKMPISACLQNMESIFSIVEVLICYLADVTVKNMIGGVIKEIPESQRRYKYVRYCFYIPALDFYQQ